MSIPQPQVRVVTVNASEVHTFSFKQAFDIFYNNSDRESLCVREIMISCNLITPVVDLVAEYLGIQVTRARDAIRGFPLKGRVLARLLRARFWQHCANSGIDFPQALEESAKRALAAAVYFWLSFLRAPYQAFYFVRSGALMWIEAKPE